MFIRTLEKLRVARKAVSDEQSGMASVPGSLKSEVNKNIKVNKGSLFTPEPLDHKTHPFATLFALFQHHNPAFPAACRG